MRGLADPPDPAAPPPLTSSRRQNKTRVALSQTDIRQTTSVNDVTLTHHNLSRVQTSNIVEVTGNIVAENGNIVAKTGINVERVYRKISFDIVAKTGNTVPENGNVVAKNGNNVEATFDFVERIVPL